MLVASVETGNIQDLLHEGCTAQHLSSIADHNERCKHTFVSQGNIRVALAL